MKKLSDIKENSERQFDELIKINEQKEYNTKEIETITMSQIEILDWKN